MNYTLVVARYNESVEWTKHFDKEALVIYDKSSNPMHGHIPVPNVGREAETYLRYIVDNYHSLPEYVVFVQGDPFPHMPLTSRHTFKADFDSQLATRPTETQCLLTKWATDPSIDEYVGLHVSDYYNILFGRRPTYIRFAQGCQYIVPRSVLLSNPLEAYRSIHQMLLNNTIVDVQEVYRPTRFDPNAMNAWTFERMAPYVFSSGALRNQL